MFSRHRVTGVLIFFLGALCPYLSPSKAAKTDVVVLDNGDYLTGEIKQLRQGRLKFKTDAMGTIYVEWNHIVSIASRQYLEFELAG